MTSLPTDATPSPTPASSGPARRTVLGTSAAAALTAAASTAVAAAPAATALTGSSVFPNLPANTSAHWHLARRAVIAPTDKIAGQILTRGTKAWLEWQLKPSAIPDTKAESLIAKYFPVVTLPTIADMKAFTSDRPWEAAPAMQRATVLRQTFGERHLLETMTEFWSDAVYVSALAKSDSFVAHFNEQVLRKHALGKFVDLLNAAVRHPALLVYLDNHVNTKENPNENFGRELLELHTVGAGNYTEEHVRNAALVLTGHGLDWTTLGYKYNYRAHYTGRVRVMGWSHPNSGTSTSYASAVLTSFLGYLARHPATAKRLATRLAVRFVSDNPPAALVDRLAQVYLANDTAVAPVLRTLFNSAEFAASVGQKVRRGQEVVGSLMRSTGVTTFTTTTDTKNNPWSAMGTPMWLLDSLGHAPRAWPAVDGYPDKASDWMTTNKDLAMWNAAETITQGWDAQFPHPPLRDVLGFKVGDGVFARARRLTSVMTGWTWSAAHVQVVAAMLYNKGVSAPPSGAVLTEQMLNENLPMAARLAASSPYFQMR